MKARTSAGREAQGDQATDPSASEHLERAEAARDEQVDEHDRERDERVCRRERQVLGDVDEDHVADELRRGDETRDDVVADVSEKVKIEPATTAGSTTAGRPVGR